MIYMDYNATTPIAPEVLDAMMPYLTSEWGNPSSLYRFGAKLKRVIDISREQVANLIGAKDSEILFTSCATEANNGAIHAALAGQPEKRHIITTVVEHSSVLHSMRHLEQRGYRVTYLSVDSMGMLKLADLENAITPETALVSLMWANNETGVIYPVEKIGQICNASGVLFHCDAVQAIGKLSTDVSRVLANYVTLSGHKFGAPKGVGALFVRNGSPYTPFILGGHQEDERRGGTENIACIVGLGVAADKLLSCLSQSILNVTELRDTLETEILHAVSGACVNGHPTERLPNTTNIHLPGLDNTAVLAMLDQAEICASSGSACMNSSITPSHVITAMTNSRKHAEESIRFSLGTSNTVDEVEKVASKVGAIARIMA